MSAAAVTEDLTPGRQVGPYTVTEAIASGAMGAVYRAAGPSGEPVAVKRLLDHGQDARFDIESRLLTRLRHPRVVRVLDHFQDDSGKYLVMDLVEGSDLARELKERGGSGLPVDDALDYAQQACEALRYVHAQNIVHRDVKPHNLIRGGEGIVLVDFGIARETDGSEPGTRAVGTPLYMAPEVMVGESISARSDVYGLAATVWALIRGRPPAYFERTSLAEEVAGVTEELERTLRAGLAPHPERRVASVEAFAAALGSPLGVSEGASLAESVPSPPARRALLEAIVRTAAGVFEAAAASIALRDDATGELVYQAAWGAGANEIVGVRLAPGAGLAGAVLESGEGVAVAQCRKDPRFEAQIAAGTGHVPYTMLVAPLLRDGAAIGVLSVLDRRDGGPYRPADLERARLFAELTMAALPAG